MICKCVFILCKRPAVICRWKAATGCCGKRKRSLLPPGRMDLLFSGEAGAGRLAGRPLGTGSAAGESENSPFAGGQAARFRELWGVGLLAFWVVTFHSPKGTADSTGPFTEAIIISILNQRASTSTKPGFRNPVIRTTRTPTFRAPTHRTGPWGLRSPETGSFSDLDMGTSNHCVTAAYTF